MENNTQETGIAEQQPNERQISLSIDMNSPLPILHAQAKMVIDSGLVTRVDEAGVMAIWATGHELGVPPMAALNNMNVIDGKAVLNKHLINALLVKSGWSPTLIEDFVDIGNNDVRTTYRFIKTKEVERLRNQKTKLAKEINNETALKELYNDINFQLSACIRDYSFTWSDAARMGLTDKSNWTKMPKIMLQTRCLTLGAREVAPEIFMGMFEVSEIADSVNEDYIIDDDGNAVLVTEQE